MKDISTSLLSRVLEPVTVAGGSSEDSPDVNLS